MCVPLCCLFLFLGVPLADSAVARVCIKTRITLLYLPASSLGKVVESVLADRGVPLVLPSVLLLCPQTEPVQVRRYCVQQDVHHQAAPEGTVPENNTR